MVQRPSYWGYWLFMTVLSLGSVLLLQDFTVSLLVLSILGSPFVLRRFVGTHQGAWIIPCGLQVASAASAEAGVLWRPRRVPQ